MAKYADIIKKSKDEKEAAQLEIVAAEAALNVKKAVLDASVAKKRAENNLELVKAAVPFDIDDFIDAKRAAKEAAEDFEDLTNLETELF